LVKGGGSAANEAVLAISTPKPSERRVQFDATYNSFRDELRRRVSYDATDVVAVEQQTPRRRATTTGTAEAIAAVFGSTITRMTPEKRKRDAALRAEALGVRKCAANSHASSNI
jgi:hypothetical protein